MKIKVLIADDHQLFREGLITMLFPNPDIEVVAQAENGTQAIEKTKKCKPDLILTDIAMPEMDGIETTQQLKELFPEIKIIAQTAYGLAGDREIALEAGCNDYIAKPISKTKLLELIQKYFK